MTTPVTGSRNTLPGLPFWWLWLKSNMLSSGPAMVSNEPSGWMRSLFSQLSSMKRRIEL